MKQLLLVIILLFGLVACKKKSEEATTYKLSEDICLACNNHSIKVIGEDSVFICDIITPNTDMVNDKFKIISIDSVICPLPNELTIFNRTGEQIIHFVDYRNSWPPYIPGQYSQNTDGLTNGLYKYNFKKETNQVEGYFIILLVKDDYIDKPFKDQPCKGCMIIDPDDHFLHGL